MNEALVALMEILAVPLLLVDPHGEISFANKLAERLTGLGSGELQRRQLAELVEPRAAVERILSCSAGGEDHGEGSERAEVRLAREGGQQIQVSLVVTPIPGKVDPPGGALVMIEDRSEQLALEASSRSAMQRSKFANDLMTHDIRSFAQTITGYLETILGGQVGPVSAAQARILKVCRRQSMRIQGLMANLQLLLDAHDACLAGRAPALHPFPLDEAVSRAFDQVQRLHEERHVILHRDLPPGAAVLACEHFPEILNNLFANAVGHNPSGSPQVWVAAEPSHLEGAPAWALSVADNGPGISQEMQRRLVDTSRPFAPGESGVGLWVVKALLHGCGGLLRCEDRVLGDPSAGVRFIAVLPVAVAEKEGDADPAGAPAREKMP